MDNKRFLTAELEKRVPPASTIRRLAKFAAGLLILAAIWGVGAIYFAGHDHVKVETI